MSRLRKASTRTSSILWRAWIKLSSGWAPYIEQPISAEDMLRQMLRASIPSVGFFFMLALAATIAAIGLIMNSGPAIIGAMIIAPLMGPIVSLSYGLAILNRQLITLSMITIAAGTILVVAISFISIFLFGTRIMGSEILSRTSPTLLDLGIAVAAGAAAAFVHSRRSIANSIAGVAIAVALVPPLAVSGIGLALRQKAVTETGISVSEFGHFSGGVEIAAGAFILFSTNFIGIIAVGILVFLFQHYAQWKKALISLTLFIGLSLFVFGPLNQDFQNLYVKNRVLRSVAELNEREKLVSSSGRIESTRVYHQNGVIHVSIDAFESKELVSSAQERLDQIQKILSANVGEPVVLEVDLVSVEIVRLKSGSAELRNTVIEPEEAGN